MKEKVIIHPVTISRKGEVKSFQIKLPSDAKRIIGIETTVRGLDVLVSGREESRAFAETRPAIPPHYLFVRTVLAGYLRLQSCERANLFYAGDVWLTNNNLGYGDFSQGKFFRGKAWTHGYRREEDAVSVNECCPLVQGIYTDQAGEQLKADAKYTVNVYLWYSTGETENKVPENLKTANDDHKSRS